MDLQNKVVLITGASSGLGKQLCYDAAKAGAVVIACARRTKLIETVKENCRIISGQRAFAYQLDISDPEQVDQVLQQIQQEVGTIDILVNNAGFGLFENYLDTPFEEIRQMFEVNVLGLMYLTQRVAVTMIEQQSGHILNVASIAGKLATPKSAVYSATKFAVLGFSNALRLELKPFNIQVTTVNPGPMDTAFFEKADPKGGYLASVQAFVTSPEVLSKKMIRVMNRPKREINQPFIMDIAAKAYILFPRVGDFLAGGIFNKK